MLLIEFSLQLGDPGVEYFDLLGIFVHIPSQFRVVFLQLLQASVEFHAFVETGFILDRKLYHVAVQLFYPLGIVGLLVVQHVVAPLQPFLVQFETVLVVVDGRVFLVFLGQVGIQECNFFFLTLHHQVPVFKFVEFVADGCKLVLHGFYFLFK